MSLILLFHTACVSDLRDTDGDGDLDVADTGDSGASGDTDTGDDTASGNSHVLSIPEGGTGTTYVEVDAAAESAWVYFDFASPTEVDVAAGWELSIERYNVRTNGGTSGTAGVEVARIDDVALEEVATAPEDGWVTDAADAPALGDWYDYNPDTHVLTAHSRVYVLRNGAGETWKLQFVDYYDDAGNSGHPSFRWAAL